jgi:propanol-preferring alcohol dehydrogenase
VLFARRCKGGVCPWQQTPRSQNATTKKTLVAIFNSWTLINRTTNLKFFEVVKNETTMKAVRLFQPGHPLERQEISVPSAGAHEVLVQVKAAGICHSDAHYRAGRSNVQPLPLTLGHEVAGVVASLGAEVQDFKIGDRVCIHYLATCGVCLYCVAGQEQFCVSGRMIGKHRDGGYAEYIVTPARSLFRLPSEIPFETGAIMMCSSATSMHALKKARLAVDETIAIFGVGGLGMSAIQLAPLFGARQVIAVDLDDRKLERAAALGAKPIQAGPGKDVLGEIRLLTKGRGVDVSLELAGVPATMQQAVRCLAIQGRAAMVGISDRAFEVSPYHELINKEAEIIGVSDHRAQELPQLIEWVRSGKLRLNDLVSRVVPLEAAPINQALDQLEKGCGDVRVVISPLLQSL